MAFISRKYLVVRALHRQSWVSPRNVLENQTVNTRLHK